MFDKQLFSEILKKIYNTFNNQRDFANSTGVNRAYLSQYMNQKLDNPPTPKILERIANNSNGIVSYAQLMEVCGYIDISSDIASEIVKQKTEYIIKNSDYLLSCGFNKDQILELQNIVTKDFSSEDYQYALDKFLSKLTLEKAYMILKLLQTMIFELQKNANEKINLSQELKIEVDNLLQKVSSLKDLDKLKNKLSKVNKLFNIPVLGKIAAGQPILAEEYLEGYLPVDPNIYGMTTADDYFYLKVSGESMNLKIHNGDYALIHKQDYADDGDIIVAIVNGDDEATLKRYKHINESTIALEPMSTFPMEPIYINLKDTNFKIIGKAIGKFGKF